MKQKTILFNILILVSVIISACSTTRQGDDLEVGNSVIAAEEENSTAEAEKSADETPEPAAENLRTRLAEGDTPLSMRLILGTFKLENTEFSIDSAQAAELLPLWKALRSLSESETVASEELQAVINQIQDTMTHEQIAAIESMDLTMQDLGTIAEDLGLDLDNFGGRSGEISPEMQGTREAARDSGQFPGGGQGAGPGGGFPGGGPGGGQGLGSGEFSPEAIETARAERGGVVGAQLGVNPFLLEAVIEFLTGKL